MKMIERVARAICRADGKDPDEIVGLGSCAGAFNMPLWQYEYGYLAYKAIEEMREPDRSMIDAGSDAFHLEADNWSERLSKTYSAMVFNVLDEAGK